MQIRYPLLLSLVFVSSSIVRVFGYSGGPDPGVNGIFGSAQTCAQAGCHSTNPLNVSGGSVTISGLPSSGWVPGQTYSLTITVQRASQRVFGFQLSSVPDTNNQQAGTLTRGSSQ